MLRTSVSNKMHTTKYQNNFPTSKNLLNLYRK